MSLNKDEYNRLKNLLYLNEIEDSRGSLLKFTITTFKKFTPTEFHKKFYDILDRFAKGEIKNLAVSMPPQVGKSEGSSRRLPSYIAGIRSDVKMGLVSYAATKAQKFGREIMNIMREQVYKDIFPEVEYPSPGFTGQKSNTNMERESVNSDGSMKFVGVDGPLTGDTIDMLIFDDLYKNWQEANSPLIQESVWDWYNTVAESRLHNDSQQLITFTRWSDNDLIAKLMDIGLVVTYDGAEDLDTVIDSLAHDQFLHINFQALKEGKPNDFDHRLEGEALWPEKHSKEKYESTRAKDSDKFDCLYQGDPQNKEGMLYMNKFKTYVSLPEFKIIKNYTDTADTGTDYLCSIVYGLPLGTDPHRYVIDLLYTDKGMEVTEKQTANLLNKNKANIALVESNNGGRSFARNIEKLVDESVKIQWFHQGDNKEARIYSNSASVNSIIVFPKDWHIRWPLFYKHVTKYKKVFKLNEFDDAPDVLTGIIEDGNKKIIKHETTQSASELGI